MSLAFDLIVYLLLITWLWRVTRAHPTSRVTIKLGDVQLTGPILKCPRGLGTRVGLLNTPQLQLGSGILLLGTRSIHTRGMHFAIDLVFLDDTHRVLGFAHSVAPGEKSVKGPVGTRAVLELAGGTLAAQAPSLTKYQPTEITPCP